MISGLRPDNRILQEYKKIVKIFLITIQLVSLRMSVCLTKRPSIFNMNELLIDSLRNSALVCLFKGIFLLLYTKNIKLPDNSIFGWILKIAGYPAQP